MKQQIIDRALAEGFDAASVAAPSVGLRDQDRLKDFVAAGDFGDMVWFEDKLDRRLDPKVLWPDVKSIIMLAMNYGPGEAPLPRLADPGLANISCYAWHRDYHDTVKKALKRVGRWMVDTFDCEIKVFVDTAPVMEKALAGQTGLGWQGKHSNLVSRDLGSWFFLGAIYTSLDLKADVAEGDHCGRCRACQDICPTNAFPKPYQVDAKRCISYLTIEHQGPVPYEFRKAMGNRIYGCDDCLAICPWNKFAKPTVTTDFLPRDGVKDGRLADMLTLDDPGFRALFTKSPVKRIGRDRFIRNCLIAAGNSGQTDLVPSVERLLMDPNPVVRGAAVWAMSQLLEQTAFAVLARRYMAGAVQESAGLEHDETVLAEWRAGLVSF